MLHSPSAPSHLFLFFFTELPFKMTYSRKKKVLLPMRLRLHEQLRNVSNSESHQMRIWLRCWDDWPRPFPMSPSYITGAIFLWMFCHAFKSNCLWNVLIPLDGVWTQERAEAERGRKSKAILKTQREKDACLNWSHDLNILGDEICPHCRDSFTR